MSVATGRVLGSNRPATATSLPLAEVLHCLQAGRRGPPPSRVAVRPAGREIRLDTGSPSLDTAVGMFRFGRSWTLGICAAALVLAAVPGCGGCRRETPAETAKKSEKDKQEDEKPKAEVEMPSLATVPADTTVAFPVAKPGHWVTVRHEIKANFSDLQGDLWTATTDMQGVPFEVQNTPFELESTRPAPLPKGQTKFFDTTYFIPLLSKTPTKGVWMGQEFRAARGGRVMQMDRSRVAAMPAYQYFFVVLSSEPDRYGYLSRLTSVSAPVSGVEETDSLLYYRVLLPRIERLAPLPSNSLTWSSIAYLLWDDLSPESLTSSQEQALTDWLHWGGQLIISGPKSLETLRGGFLDRYLPAKAERTVEADPAALAELNATWSLRAAKTGELLRLEPPAGKPLVTVQFSKHPDAEFLAGCGQLVVERRIGGGRIVVTAFSLTDRSVVNWGSFDSFFNGCLLRRPPRKFQVQDQFADTVWFGYHPSLVTDSRFVTTLRYFTRDMGHFVAGPGGLQPAREPDAMSEVQESVSDRESEARALLRPPSRRSNSKEDFIPRDNGLHINGYPLLPHGIAAWNDRSGVSDAARQAIRDAAGISIPRGGFVLRALLAYLLFLVPINWGLFRLLGRVEWAWVLAPLIGIVAAVAVVRFAQLDIGFARSVTEFAVAETHAGYPRAHLTRYTALYTSLATTYSLQFDSEDALAQPFGSATDYVRGPNDAASVVTLRRERELSLRGFKVPSNKTGIVHAEQMCDLGGGFSLAKVAGSAYELKNGTRLALRGAGVLHRNEQGGLEGAWIGDLAAGAAVRLDLQPTATGTAHLPQWDESFATLSYETQARQVRARLDANGDDQLDRREASAELAAEFARLDRNNDRLWNHAELIEWCRRSRAGEVSLGQCVELASQGLRLSRGELRLIAWSDEELPSMSVRPSACPSRSAHACSSSTCAAVSSRRRAPT